MYHIRPEFILLQLKQGDLPPEGYTIMFQLVAHTTSYPDDALYAFYAFYDASLNASCRAPLSEDGPRADFAAFVEWTLARNRSSFPACSMDNLASATPDPEPSQPPRPAEYQPEPTDDGELQPAATSVPSLRGATEQLFTTEPELHEPSDQVREPATMTAMVEGSVENESAEDSITHCTTAEGEQNWILGHLTMNDIPDNSEDVNTGLSLTICAVGSPQVCQSPSASWLEDPSSPPSASESWTPPQPSDSAAPPHLSAPSSPPSPVGPPAPPGSIVLSAPLSVVIPPSPQDSTPPAVPRRSIPPAPWNSSIPLVQPQSSVAPAPPRTSGSPSPPWSPEPWAPPGPSGSSVCRQGSSALRLRLGLYHHLLHLRRSAPWSRQPFQSVCVYI
ncbi:Accumulation-associated protein [Labeo rohita]|uniref:Accumulation-associated protein n=1 Tax=Labeo rohita TaxID=84645 RepID=A0ABQ8MSK1_LABRO|nr:Accumulation-associated protein [Labeo rohita]